MSDAKNEVPYVSQLIVLGGLCMTPVVLGGVALMLHAQGHAEDLMSEQESESQAIIALLIAAACVPLGRVVQRMVGKAMQSVSDSRRAFTSGFIGSAVTELAAISGLIFYVLYGDLTTALIMMGISLAGQVTYVPFRPPAVAK